MAIPARAGQLHQTACGYGADSCRTWCCADYCRLAEPAPPGVLVHGFLRVHCDACDEDRVVLNAHSPWIAALEQMIRPLFLIFDFSFLICHFSCPCAPQLFSVVGKSKNEK